MNFEQFSKIFHGCHHHFTTALTRRGPSPTHLLGDADVGAALRQHRRQDVEVQVRHFGQALQIRFRERSVGPPQLMVVNGGYLMVVFMVFFTTVYSPQKKDGWFFNSYGILWQITRGYGILWLFNVFYYFYILWF